MMKLACFKYMPPNGSENAGHPDRFFIVFCSRKDIFVNKLLCYINVKGRICFIAFHESINMCLLLFTI